MLSIFDNIVQQQKDNQSYDPEFWTLFNKKIKEGGIEELSNQLIPIYDKYFTEKQLIKIIQFYESDIGKHVLSTKNQILEESMKVGEEWGADMGQEILAEIESLNDSLMQIEQYGCEKFRNGKFKMMLQDSTPIFFERNDSVQTEFYGETEYIFNIEWTGPCRYEMKDSESNGDNNLDIIVNIYKIEGDKYHYIARGRNNKLYDKSDITKIEYRVGKGDSHP